VVKAEEKPGILRGPAAEQPQLPPTEIYIDAELSCELHLKALIRETYGKHVDQHIAYEPVYAGKT
jgi:hypothetical protein